MHYAGYVAPAAHHHHPGDHRRPARLPPLRTYTPQRFQFTVAPIPGGADRTFYLGATAAQYTDLFGAAPTRRLFALPQHSAQPPAPRRTRGPLPSPEQAALVHATVTGWRPRMDIDPPTQMVWPVGDGHAVLLGDALAPVRPHTARGANNGIEQAAGLGPRSPSTASTTPTCPPPSTAGSPGTCPPRSPPSSAAPPRPLSTASATPTEAAPPLARHPGIPAAHLVTALRMHQTGRLHEAAWVAGLRRAGRPALHLARATHQAPRTR